jgi:hypothetical protein
MIIYIKQPILIDENIIDFFSSSLLMFENTISNELHPSGRIQFVPV